MTAPFVSLTLPGYPGLEPQPIFINAYSIRTVHPNWKRNRDVAGQPASDPYTQVGTWVCVGDGDRAIDRYAYTAGYNDGRSAPAKARGVS